MRSAEFSSKDAREIVVLVIVSNYLLVIADQSEVESATSQRDTAKALFQQTSDQKTAGLASAVDVLRSQVQLQSREQKLIVAKNTLAKQKLVLARAIGLPPGQTFEITTRLPYRELTPSSLDEAIQSAYKARADFQGQMNQVRSAELARRAASAERYPSMGVETDYGLSGVNPGSSHGTVDAAATLRIPVFQGGRVHGDILRADASLTRERQRLEDLRARIDQEVRDAYLDLESAAQEVAVEKARLRSPHRPWNSLAIDSFPELPTTLKSFKHKMRWQSLLTATLPVFIATTLQKYLWPERSAWRNQALLNTWRENEYG